MRSNIDTMWRVVIINQFYFVMTLVYWYIILVEKSAIIEKLVPLDPFISLSLIESVLLKMNMLLIYSFVDS